MTSPQGRQMDTSHISPHSNHELFSDHFLTAADLYPRLSTAEAAQAQALREEIAALYQRVRPLVSGAKEAVVEDELIEPVLKLFGFALDPKPPLPTEEAAREPDYALFADDATLREAAQHRRQQQYFAAAAALCEAKPWDQPLGASHAGRHPGAQLRSYLTDSRVRWGILTNGRLWRLYEREASTAGFRYYEVNLPHLLDADLQDFRYFYLFFRRAAFEPDPAKEGRCYLAEILQGSRDYWLGLTDRLKDRVYDALAELMTGIFEGSPHLWPEDLDDVHEAALVLLYRLLFAFYAEARGLLPADNADYAARYSVQARRDDVTAALNGGDRYPGPSTQLWAWTQNLCRLIDGGDEELGVPQYNGGLFREGRWPLLDDPRVAVHDRHVARVIDLLGRDRDPDTGRLRNLDYHELGVRELGSIYEGLLELRPQWNADEVEFVTDRGERKATGSYYTPDYIVRYIVENTLDPLLKDCAARVAERAPEVQAAVEERERLIEERGPDDPEDEKTLDVIEQLKLDLLEPYFELMVLDPAMGSGHFLVGASEEIAQAILTDPSHLPPAGVESLEDENLYYRRRVVERCLYGVDLNPLAVELAKLSLWLHTVECGKPLSFLDHHLRCGNSLIGARLAEMKRLPEPKKKPKEEQPPVQLNLFTQRFLGEAQRLLQGFQLIETMPTDTVKQERQKERAYEQVERRRERFRQVANLWLSVYFENEVDDAEYARAVGALGDEAALAEVLQEPWFQRAQQIAAERRFFHWELEFPDAFFTERGMKPEADRGFDAVIGNPPYVRVRRLREKGDPGIPFYESGAFECAVRVYDLYLLVLEQAMRLTKRGGFDSFIVPVQTLHQPNCLSLRRLLTTKGTIVLIADLAALEVFDEAIVKTCILTYTPQAARDSARVRYVEATNESDLVRPDWAPVTLQQIRARENASFKPDLLAARPILVSIWRTAAPLGDLFYVTFGLRSCAPGTARGGKDRLIVDRALDATCKPYLEGRETARYYCGWTGRYIRYIPEEMYSPRDPGFFEQPKIVSHTMLTYKRLVATLDSEGRYVEQSLLCVLPHGILTKPVRGPVPQLAYVLSCLNSTLVSYVFAREVIGYSLGGGLIHATPGSQEKLPIRLIDFSHPTVPEAKHDLLARCREAIEGGDYETPLGLARRALAAHAVLYGPAGKPELREDYLGALTGEGLGTGEGACPTNNEEVDGSIVGQAPSPVQTHAPSTTHFEKRQRHLPHWEEPGAIYFVTICTREETAGLLTQPQVAKILTAALHHDAGKRYELYSYVLMPDHLHLIIRPLRRGKGVVPLTEIMQALKSVMAHRINSLLGRKGRLWRDESYDRIIRDEDEYAQKVTYIEANPVQAGLVQRADEWPWIWPPFRGGVVGQAPSPVQGQQAERRMVGQAPSPVQGQQAERRMVGQASSPVHGQQAERRMVGQASSPVHADQVEGPTTAGFPGREDFVHDLLAELAQRMMDLNKEKHEEMDGFLRWLERHLGCAIDELAGKSLIRNYDDRAKIAAFDDLCRRLSTAANRRKMQGDPRRRSFQEPIEDAFDNSMNKLDPLNEALARTDRLIDAIVYVLYGLTEEEIAIIEESLP